MSENIVNKPWGSYQTIYGDKNTQVKVIKITPNENPSYQYHFKRTETWVVVSGKGLLTQDGTEKEISAGMVVFVPKQSKHKVKNIGKEELVFVEVQLGEYFGEDDIVRIDDKYGRQL